MLLQDGAKSQPSHDTHLIASEQKSPNTWMITSNVPLCKLTFVKVSYDSVKKDVPFNIGDWNAKVGSQEIPEVTGNFGLGVQNEERQKLTEFCQQNTLIIATTLFLQHNTRLYTWTSPDGQY